MPNRIEQATAISFVENVCEWLIISRTRLAGGGLFHTSIFPTESLAKLLVWLKQVPSSGGTF